MGWVSKGLAYLQAHWIQISLHVAAALGILLAAAIIGGALGRWAEKRLRRRGGRTEALAGVTRSAVRSVVLVIGIITALDQIGVNVTTLLAGAGVLGLAVGFGAQSLVKDVISGFFLIFDGAIAEGDIADVGGGAVGVVESVGLRVTTIRAFNGQLWYVHNGQIATVGNLSREWTRAVVDVGLAYEQDTAKGLKVLKEVGDAWAAENEEIVLEPPEAQGLLGLNASDVGVRLVVKVKAPNHAVAERELRQRIKAAFDAEGVEIPFPRQVTYHRQEAETAPLRVQGAGAAKGDGAARPGRNPASAL